MNIPMRTLAILLTSAALLLGSCSDSDDEPSNSVSIFEAEFLTLEPSSILSEETYYSLDTALKLLDANEIGYDRSAETKVIEYAGDRKTNERYTLTLAATSADLTIATTGTEEIITQEVETTTYTFAPGLYRLKAPVSDPARYTDYIRITESAITLLYEYEEGKFADYQPIVLPLENGRFSRHSATGRESVRNQETDPVTYKGIFHAVTDPNGVAVLKNSDFTFNFIPATGMLTCLEPDYREIGRLDRVK